MTKIQKVALFFEYWVKIKPDINPTYGYMGRLQKCMSIECKSYVIGQKFINPIYVCGVKYPLKLIRG